MRFRRIFLDILEPVNWGLLIGFKLIGELYSIAGSKMEIQFFFSRKINWYTCKFINTC